VLQKGQPTVAPFCVFPDSIVMWLATTGNSLRRTRDSPAAKARRAREHMTTPLQRDGYSP
jgi:hypothetical protein